MKFTHVSTCLTENTCWLNWSGSHSSGLGMRHGTACQFVLSPGVEILPPSLPHQVCHWITSKLLQSVSQLSPLALITTIYRSNTFKIQLLLCFFSYKQQHTCVTHLSLGRKLRTVGSWEKGAKKVHGQITLHLASYPGPLIFRMGLGTRLLTSLQRLTCG